MAKNSLSDLLAQRASLEKQIASFQKEQRGDAIAKVKTLMAEYGLTAADLGGKAPAAPGPKAAKAAKAPAAAKKTTGKKVAPKYRNAATGDTWSGRGLKPKWLTAALAAGKSITDFAI